MRVGLQYEFFAESRDGVSQYLRIAERTDATAATEHCHMDSQTMQCLAQFKPNNPGADHGHGTGQIVPVEHIVVDDQALAQALVRIQGGGSRTGSDDATLAGDPGMLGDFERMVIDEARLAANTFRLGSGNAHE